MKVTRLITSIGEFSIEESVAEIKTRKAALIAASDDIDKAQGLDLDFTILNTKSDEKYAASIVLGRYMAVREVEIIEEHPALRKSPKKAGK